MVIKWNQTVVCGFPIILHSKVWYWCLSSFLICICTRGAHIVRMDCSKGGFSYISFNFSRIIRYRLNERELVLVIFKI